MKSRKCLYAVLAALLFLALTGKTIYERVSSLAAAFREGSADAGALTLYARSAVLMDADSGRILYDKDGETPMPMASTTKIMTLILALELGQEGEIAEASSYAAGQPKVRLGMQAGEQFYLSDLYYSLMLESHNDTAVCIAETIGRRLLEEGEASTSDSAEENQMADELQQEKHGQTTDGQGSNAPKTGNQAQDNTPSGENAAVPSTDSKTAVHAFVSRMNEKAAELGLSHTYFVTPNGLDGEEELADGTKKAHSTTAAELAAILRYCIMESPEREGFLAITRTASYTFSDIQGKRSFSCSNHNQFLHMMEGALTGKTGFTAKAGYCYVGALRRENRTFLVALLACGWPNNKTYKWADTKKLMQYGLDHYAYRDVYEKNLQLDPIPVSGAAPKAGEWVRPGTVPVELRVPEKEQTLPVLLRPEESVDVIYEGKQKLSAPVDKGAEVGTVRYRLGDLVLAEYPVYTKEAVKAFTFDWCLHRVLEKYLLVYSRATGVL